MSVQVINFRIQCERFGLLSLIKMFCWESFLRLANTIDQLVDKLLWN